MKWENSWSIDSLLIYQTNTSSQPSYESQSLLAFTLINTF